MRELQNEQNETFSMISPIKYIP